MSDKPVALVTGVSRRAGIGAACADALESTGWTVARAGWPGYDERMPWGVDDDPLPVLAADLEDSAGPADLIERVNRSHGAITGLVMCHAESVDSSIADTTVESFDRHYAVNVRAVWLLIKSFAVQFPGPPGTGRIIAMTSDDTAFNLPYGATKGALDRIVLAASVELAEIGVTANVINPGPNQTGWIGPELEASILRNNLQPRLGTPEDCANFVAFLCSPRGQWINGQLLHSDGGRRSRG